MNAKSDSEMEAKAEHEELDAMGHEARRHRAHLTRSVLLKTDTRYGSQFTRHPCLR